MASSYGIAAALAQESLQVLARDVFHDDEELALVQPEIMDGDNVGMGKVGRGARLLAKTLLEGIDRWSTSHAGS